MALGDAYMAADLYKHALKAYSHALEANKNNEKNVLCVGKLLVMCHQYEQATDHYKTFLKRVPDNIGITIKLVSLYANTKKLMEAQTTLNNQINIVSQNKDPAEYYEYIILYIKLAQVLFSQGEYIKCKDVLHDTIRLHNNFMKTPSFKPDAHGEIQDMISSLVVSLLNSDSIHCDSTVALELCKLADGYDDNDINILFAMTNILFKQQKFDDCLMYCKKILSLHASHEGAIVILGKISIAQSHFNEAYRQYNSFSENNQNCYMVIYELFQLMNRMDRGQEMKALFEEISCNSSSRANSSPVGGCYLCKVRERILK